MQAVVLAGGKGTRLAERLNGRPKPLVDVDGEPLLHRQLRTLAEQGVHEAVVLVSHAAEQIAASLERTSQPCRVRLIDDGEPRGTAGAVLACMDVLESRFLVVYGDTLFDIDVPHMLHEHETAAADATLLIHPNDHPADSDLVEVDAGGMITAFHPYPHPPGHELQNLVNAAFYVVDRRALEPFREAAPPLDFAKDLFPLMLAEGARLRGYTSFEYIKDIGTPARLDKAEGHLRAGVVERAARRNPQRAVFVDRDGTLNVLRDYVRRASELELLPGAAAAVRRLNGSEHRVVVVTNQPVIARGDTTTEQLAAIHARLSSQLGREGGFFDALYYCPHHPQAGHAGEVAELKIICECRKPGKGLFLQAARDLNLDLGRSWMVGDSTADMKAAEALGLASVLVLTGEGGHDGKHRALPDYTAVDIAEAAEIVAERHPRLARQLAPALNAMGAGDLVLLGGPARSGKSTAASALKVELRRRGVTAMVVELDRWILPEGDRGAGVLGRFDMNGAVRELTPWLAGEALRLEGAAYDRRTRTRVPGESLEATADAVLIVEGVPALVPEWLTARRQHRLHLEAPVDVRRVRVIDDLVARGLHEREAAQSVFEAREVDEVSVIAAAAATADMRLSPT